MRQLQPLKVLLPMTLCCRSGPPHSSVLLLGLQHRRQQDCSLGEQDHVVHHHCVRPVPLTWLLRFQLQCRHWWPVMRVMCSWGALCIPANTLVWRVPQSRAHGACCVYACALVAWWKKPWKDVACSVTVVVVLIALAQYVIVVLNTARLDVSRAHLSCPVDLPTSAWTNVQIQTAWLG